MRKKQMLATMVMLSLLQGSVYAETVDNFTLNAANPTKSFNEDTIVTGRVTIKGGNNHSLVGTINVNDGQGTLKFTSGKSINWTQGGTVSVNASNTIFTGSNSNYTFEKDSNKGTLKFSGDLIFKDLISGAAIRGNDTSNISEIIAAGDISFNNVSTDEQVASLQAVSLIGKNITADDVHQTSYDMVGSAFWVHRGVLGAKGDSNEEYNGNISVKKSSFEHSAYGSAAIWADNAGQVLANDVVVDNIEFLSSTGRDKSNYVGSGIHAENGSHVIVGEKISVENINGSTINVAGIDLEGKSNVGGITPPGGYDPEDDPATLLQTGEIYIKDISSETEGLNAFGIRALGDNEKAEGLKIQANKLTVNDVAGTFAYGFAQLNAAQAYFDEAEIANINGTMEGAGVYLLGSEGDSEVEFGKLKIHDISVEEGGLISLANVSQGVLKADVAELFTNNNLAYHGSYAEDASSDEVKIDEIGLRSVAGGLIDFTNENGSYTIVGNLVAGYGSELPSDLTESTIDGGKITINGKNTQIYGDVFAGNGGEINITLNSGNILEGQVDDYHELVNEDMEGKVFRNSAFVDSEGNPLDVVAAGNATLNINDGAHWIARGQSFVNTVTLNGGIIDMSRNENSSVTVKNLNGKGGKFKMRLDTGDHANSDMLYVTGRFEGTYELDIIGNEFVPSEITEDNPLRFATVKGDVNTENMNARVTDAGFFNNTYKSTKEQFDKNHSENEDYNGKNNGQESYKPGNDAVLSMFDNGDTNLLITNEGKQSTVSDAGKTIINMSRANYNNAIYMDRLNKRMGEARYINPEEKQGMWVRLRHDRIGKDDAFRSQNTMYELGYDVKQDCDNGEHRTGFAIDYMDGKTEYNGIAGDGDIKRYGLWLYDTWLGDKGHYTDFVAKWGHLENDFDIMAKSIGEKITGDYSNNVFSVSAEYGKKNDMGSGWYIEPQAQLQLARVTGADYTTSQGTKVSLDGINSLIGRAGFRLGRDLNENSTVYVKADLLHEFLGDQTISAYDITTNGVYRETFENKGTWYDVGFGFATALGKNSYAFMDFEKSFGNDNDETYQINAGVQWTF